ncbi:MAG: DUF4838 domain-containing protein [Firmicutes bacterium]|nr:DUF4838 domain-containing protein [Bacillota bacterium]
MLAKNQKAQVLILTAQDPTPQEEYAAKELRHYLHMMTGALFTIVSEPNPEMPNVIAIGSAGKHLGLQYDKTLGPDGFTVCTIGDSIGIVGGVRGVIYGVYELLEHMGCRFFTSLCEKIPVAADLPIPQIDTSQKPVLEYRAHNYREFTQFPRFAVKSRINMGGLRSGNIAPGSKHDNLGGGIEYAWFVHTFDSQILDPAEHFDKHPEYFSMVDGKRLKEFTQLCLTNPDVVEIAIEKVRAALRAKPHCRIISVSANDWYNYCTCPACAQLDAEEGTNAASLIWFVNQIAEAINEEFPDVIIDTLAYQHTRQAPKTMRPHPNVCIRLCTIEACFAHPLDSCDDDSRKTARPDGTRTHILEDLEDWAKVCDRLYIWDYTTGFAHYPAPHANWGVLQPNMQAFVRNNAKGVFEQACGAIGGSTDLNELRAYVLAKLLWDANCDVKKHMREFCDFYYGAAAPYILEYIQTLTDKVEKDNIHTGFNDQCNKAYLTDEMLDIYDSIFDNAETAVVGDAIRHMRIAKARLSLRWVRLKNNQMLKGIVNPNEINQFFTDWRAHGLTRIDEWAGVENTLRAMLDGKWRGVEYYHHWTDEGPERL